MTAEPERRTRKRQRLARPVGSRKRPTSAARRELVLRTLQGFRMIFASARAHDAEVRRIAGVSGSQLWALSEIGRGQGLSVNGLAEQMALHQTTASNLVNALVERKLVRRARDDEDQRIVRLHITTDGKRLLLRAPGPYAGLLVDGLRNLDDEQLVRLRKDLKNLLAGMRDPATTAAGETLLGE
jgi:DNA-binding MarR family transcriptional regulator